MTVVPFKKPEKQNYKKDILVADRWEELHKPDLGSLPMKNKLCTDIEELRLTCALYEQLIEQMGTKIAALERELSGFNRELGKR